MAEKDLYAPIKARRNAIDWRAMHLAADNRPGFDQIIPREVAPRRPFFRNFFRGA